MPARGPCSAYASTELGGKVIGGGSGGRRDLDHPVVRFAPRRGMAQLDFADALNDRPPEVAEHDEWARLHHAFVKLFPPHGQLDERPGPALAGDVAVAASHQFEEPRLPRVHANFLVDPTVRARLEKFRGDGERAPAGVLGAARGRLHYTAVAAGAHDEALRRERVAQLTRLGIAGVALFRTAAAKHSDDLALEHQRFLGGSYGRHYCRPGHFLTRSTLLQSG